MSSVQFQPYRAGWVTSPFRLAPNTTAITTASTPAADPARVARTGAVRRPAPRSSAARMPATAVTGRPASRAALVTGEGPLAGVLGAGPADPPGSAAGAPR